MWMEYDSWQGQEKVKQRSISLHSENVTYQNMRRNNNNNKLQHMISCMKRRLTTTTTCSTRSASSIPPGNEQKTWQSSSICIGYCFPGLFFHVLIVSWWCLPQNHAGSLNFHVLCRFSSTPSAATKSHPPTAKERLCNSDEWKIIGCLR